MSDPWTDGEVAAVAEEDGMVPVTGTAAVVVRSPSFIPINRLNFADIFPSSSPENVDCFQKVDAFAVFGVSTALLTNSCFRC